MKHLKIIGLAAMAIAALMAFAGSASANPTLTSPAGTEYTGEIHATLNTPNSALLKAGIEDTCGFSTVAGKVTTNNTTHASGSITKLVWEDCTKTTHTIKSGSLTISPSGTVTGSGSEVTVFDLGVSCVYGTGAGTHLGTLKPGTLATLEINTNALEKISGGFLCAQTGTWTAKYTVTTPHTLLLS